MQLQQELIRFLGGGRMGAGVFIRFTSENNSWALSLSTAPTYIVVKFDLYSRVSGSGWCLSETSFCHTEDVLGMKPVDIGRFLFIVSLQVRQGDNCGNSSNIGDRSCRSCGEPLILHLLKCGYGHLESTISSPINVIALLGCFPDWGLVWL